MKKIGYALAVGALTLTTGLAVATPAEAVRLYKSGTGCGLYDHKGKRVVSASATVRPYDRTRVLMSVHYTDRGTMRQGLNIKSFRAVRNPHTVYVDGKRITRSSSNASSRSVNFIIPKARSVIGYQVVQSWSQRNFAGKVLTYNSCNVMPAVYV